MSSLVSPLCAGPLPPPPWAALLVANQQGLILQALAQDGCVDLA